MSTLGRLFGRGRVETPAPTRVARSRIPAAGGLPRRSYAAAQGGRLVADWYPSAGDHSSQLAPGLALIRSRARQLFRDEPYARKFVGMLAANVVGPSGIRLQMAAIQDGDESRRDQDANRRIERAWGEWGALGIPTADGTMSWREVQQVAITTVARDGEFLARKVATNNRFAFGLELIEPDFLDHRINRPAATGQNEITLGVERDGWRRPVAYWFTRRPGGSVPPAAFAPGVTHERVPADQVIHIFLREFASQVRGVSWLAPAMFRLRMLAGYEEAALTAARAGASKMGFFEQTVDAEDDGAGRPEDADGRTISEFEPAIMETLPPGLTFKEFNPGYPDGEFDPFVKRILRAISSGLGVSYNTLASDLEGVNYSSIRQGVLDERDTYRQLQYWLIERLHAPTFDAWLRGALLARAINLPLYKFDNFNRPRWLPRGWSWVDPEKDMNAATSAIGQALATRSDVAASQGRDFEEIVERLVDEKRILDEAGIATQPILVPPSSPAKD